MIRSDLIYSCIVILCFLMVGETQAQERLRREDAFFGFHFDFHATSLDTGLGGNFEVEPISNFIERTRPDYIQVDSKGHPGYSSYPTAVGYSPGNFAGDPLRKWRDVTDRFNLPLYVHYSGIWDDKAVQMRPDWARVKADGALDMSFVSVVGEYPAKLMIPQIKEMIERYHIDGIWVDGDCWSTGLDYSPKVVSGFLTQSGLETVPREIKDIGYKQWMDYQRRLFKDYLRNYTDELHRFKPGFQVTSNWAYSSMMPEPVDVNLDFLSGDVSGKNCVYSAAFQSRCLALQGKPWDLMAWGFVPMDFSGGIHSPKSALQLKQEAAQVLSVGGGFQVYFQQNRDASFQTTIDVDAMEDLALFCRARQSFCHRAVTVPQIAVWYSYEGWKKRSPSVYGWSSHMEGITSLLLDGRHAVEITMDHHLQDSLEAYPLIVVPEWDAFDESLKERLLNHVANGASVLVVGAKAVKGFEPLLGVRFDGKSRSDQFNIGDKALGGVTGIQTHWQPAIAEEGTQVVGHIYKRRDYRFVTPYAAATITNYGRGKLSALYVDFSEAYNESRHPIYNRLVDRLINEIFPNAKLTISGVGNIHTTLTSKGKDLMVNLINIDGAHFNGKVNGYDHIAPSGPLSITVETGKKPSRVVLQPEGEVVDYVYDKHTDRVTVRVPSVDIHRIIQLENSIK